MIYMFVIFVLVIVVILLFLAIPLYSKIGQKIEQVENKIKEEIKNNEK